MTLFWKRGFEATSMQELEACTGLSRSSLYNSFGPKRGLFERAMGRYEERGRLISSLRDGALGLDDVHSLFDALVTGLSSRSPARGCFMVNTMIEFGGKDAAIADTGKLYFDRVQASPRDGPRA